MNFWNEFDEKFVKQLVMNFVVRSSNEQTSCQVNKLCTKFAFWGIGHPWDVIFWMASMQDNCCQGSHRSTARHWVMEGYFNANTTTTVCPITTRVNFIRSVIQAMLLKIKSNTVWLYAQWSNIALLTLAPSKESTHSTGFVIASDWLFLFHLSSCLPCFPFFIHELAPCQTILLGRNEFLLNHLSDVLHPHNVHSVK